jgi:hypothetical protein
MTSPAPPISEFKKAAIAFREAASVATNLEDLEAAFEVCNEAVTTAEHREWLDNEMDEALDRLPAQVPAQDPIDDPIDDTVW